MATYLENKINNQFTSLDPSKAQLLTDLSEANKGIEDLVNGEAVKLLDGTYLTNTYPEFSTYTGTEEDFIKEELSLDEKLAAISKFKGQEFLATGNNDFTDKVRKAQKAKDLRKTRLKELAQKVIGHYEAILVDIDKNINVLENEMQIIKDNINKAEQQIIDITAQKDSEIRENATVSGTSTTTSAIDKVESIKQLEQKIEN